MRWLEFESQMRIVQRIEREWESIGRLIDQEQWRRKRERQFKEKEIEEGLRERESEGDMKVYKFVREWKMERKRDWESVDEKERAREGVDEKKREREREKVCVSVCCGEERLGVNMQ